MRRLILCSLVTGLCAGATTLALPAHAASSRPGGDWPTRPAAVATQGAGSGLTGSYFANGSLAGAPLQIKVDPAINFNWGTGAPGPDLSDDNFSIRWEGLLAAPSTGAYRFIGKTVDEVRVWVNGKKIIDTFNGNKIGAAGSTSVGLAGGEKTTIKVEFAAGEGIAQFQLMWAAPGQAPQVIPTAYLYPQGSPTTPDPAGAVAAAAPAAQHAAAPKIVAKAKVEPKARVAAPVAAAAPAKPVAKPAEVKVAKVVPKVDPAIALAEKAAADKAKAAAEKAKADKALAKAAAKAAKEATPPAAPALEPGLYVLTSRTTGKPLEVYDPTRPNSHLYQPVAVGATGTAEAAQNTAPQWRIERLADGFYRLVVPGNNRVLEVLGSSTSNGAEMDLWPYYSGNNQVWRIEPTEDGYYKLLAKHSNKALTAKDSLDGSLQQWRYTGKENQMWKLQTTKAEEPSAAAMVGSKPGVGAHKMSIYPNPSNGVVQLRYELPEEIPMGWVLYSQNGAPVRVSDYRKQPAGTHHQTLDFTNLPTGDYNLRMTVGNVTTRESLQLRNPKVDPVPTAPIGSN